MEHTLWYRFTGTGGRVVLSTAGSNFDTLIGVYQANAAPSTATTLLCSDDVRGQQAELALDTVAGATYYTQWGGCVGDANCGADSGFLALSVLTNDQRAFAAPAVSSARGNLGATVDPGEVTTCGGAAYNATTWFRWQAPAKGRVTFDVARFDTVAALYVGDSPTPATCNDDVGADVLRSQVSADVQAGGVYYLQVGGKSATAAPNDQNFSLGVNFAEDLDVDDDGYQRGPDCNDGNAAIRPGARDVPGNRIDEDCKNGDARFPRITSTVSFRMALGPNYWRFTSLSVRSVPPRARISIRCRGRGCPYRSKTFRTSSRTRRSVSLMTKRVRDARLKRGAVLEVRVTRRDRIGKVQRYSFRRYGSEPRKSTLCLAPTARNPRRC
jgi:hypothetical protein